MPVILEGAQALRPLATRTVSFGATATTDGTSLGSQLIRLNTTAAVCVDLEGLAASTATSFRMSADQTEYFKVSLQTPGQKVGCKAADSSAGGILGVLYITELG